VLHPVRADLERKEEGVGHGEDARYYRAVQVKQVDPERKKCTFFAINTNGTSLTSSYDKVYLVL
jgi:hypothetical protein